MIKVIDVDGIPKAGPYSHAVSTGNLVFLSGQVGNVSGTQQTLEVQFENIMVKVKKILEAADYSLSNVVKSSVYLAKKDDFQKFNELYSKYFSKNSPARTTVVTGFVNSDVLIEMDFIVSK